MQIFILGMHRSGTSLVARLVNMMGAYFGGEGVGLPTNDENPKGFWERRDVVALNERLFAEQDATWFDVLPIVEASLAGHAPAATRTDDAIGTLVAELDAHRPWFVKDPRLCLTFAHWRRHCEVPVAIVCLRNIGAIAASMSRRSGLTGLTYDQAVALARAHLAVLARRLDGVARVVVRYERFLEDPVGETSRLYAALRATGLGGGLRKPDDAQVERFVEPALRRSHDEDAFDALGDELERALVDGRDVDAWFGEDVLGPLRAVRYRRDEEARQRSERLAAVANLTGRLRNVDLQRLFADDQAAHGSAPWTLERLRRLPGRAR